MANQCPLEPTNKLAVDTYYPHGLLDREEDGGSDGLLNREKKRRQRPYELRLHSGASFVLRGRRGSEPYLSKPSRPMFKFDTLNLFAFW